MAPKINRTGSKSYPNTKSKGVEEHVIGTLEIRIEAGFTKGNWKLEIGQAKTAIERTDTRWEARLDKPIPRNWTDFCKKLGNKKIGSCGYSQPGQGTRIG